ncbi:MAG: hypothetical protein HUJ91_05580 [Bacteroidales bacterium]|nr:hypothetical protein [Bacteroidales bacterium]
MQTTGFGSETLGLRERELVCVFPYIISEGVPSVENFMEETGLRCDNILQIDGQQLLRITRGTLPMILVVSGGKVLAEYGYRDLH